MSVPAAYLGVIIIWSTAPLAIKWSGEDTGFLLGVSRRMLIGALLSEEAVFNNGSFVSEPNVGTINRLFL